MADLVTWLREQIADRRQRAEAAGGDRWYQDGKTGEIIATNGKTAENCAGGYWEGIAEHIEANDPREALAQCEAHTALLDSYAEHIALPEYTPYVKGRRDKALHDVRLLALAYQHRPGYREEWRP